MTLPAQGSRRLTRSAATFGVVTMAALAAAGCTSASGSAATTVTVASSDEACTLSVTTAPAGTLAFAVRNEGGNVTEFYVYEDDGTTILSEVENVGPGTTRELVLDLAAGTYITACDPGMDGDELRGDFVVTGDASAPVSASPELQAAADNYLGYVRNEVATLLTKTTAFADAVVAGNDDLARSLYADARVHWERIEPVAESFGDLDPRLDLREADLGPQESWTGWHHLEKILWPPAGGYEVTGDERAALAEQLIEDTQTLSDRVLAPDFALEPFQLGNGAKELLDEVAATKITGEEEIWSGTDLWDIQANIDGAEAAYLALRPVVSTKDPELVATLDERFAETHALLATYGSIEAGFVSYPTLTHDEVLELSRTIEALSEPLSRLTAAAVL